MLRSVFEKGTDVGLGCHVMEKESFMSLEVAELLNNDFIPIKLDRESRPDVDEIYMHYVTATAGSGGWPLNVFLTPDLEPVFGGTYWPSPGSNSLPRISKDSDETPLTFIDILGKMRDVWKNQQSRCVASATEITNQLREFAAEGTKANNRSPGSEEAEPLDLDLLDDALDHFIARYDAINGGFSPPSRSGPKFPTPPNLAFLLRIGAAIENTSTRFGFPSPVPPILGREACANAASMALHTLLCISRSGLRDHLGHGFHRYSVTADWNLPHFEKMLCDNAQLLSCYCDAWALSRNPEILGTIYSLVEYFTDSDSPIVSAEGGLFASEDADSLAATPGPDGVAEKREGAYYVWSMKRIHSVIGSERDANIIARHFGVTADGNVPAEQDVHDEFLNQNTLHITATPATLAQEFGLSEEEVVKSIKTSKSRLQEHRSHNRPAPEIDTKILAGWNGLAVSALCRASNTLAEVDEERASRCRVTAIRTAIFIKDKMYDMTSGKLTRVYAPSSAALSSENEDKDVAFLDDYAYVTQAALAVYDVTFDDSWLEWAYALQGT